VKIFECQNCGQLLYFENIRCEHCGHVLGFLPETLLLTALQDAGEPLWRPLAAADESYRFCANAAHGVCNWLVPAGGENAFCRACSLNRTIPDLDVAGHLKLWQRLENAKHRVVYGLLRLGLPLESKELAPDRGMAFDFLAAGDGSMFREGPQIMTGHSEGLITINLAEADDAERERQRQNMAEPYRTIIGHFRHEVGHHYWERLLRDSSRIEACRKLFGDERRDYGEALEQYYANPPQPGWHSDFVSAYASAHPWEDFAETWAHYLHIVDTLETAHAFGLGVHPALGPRELLTVEADFDPYLPTAFERLIEAWLPLTYAVNSLNHSMGQPAFYPFVLSPAVMEKLRFVHDLIRG
jgi:hypothetical protein